MIFRPFLARSILGGTKTETRRLVHPGDEAWDLFHHIASVKRNGKYMWKVNDGSIDWIGHNTYGSNAATHSATYRQPTYSIQTGRGKPAIGKVRIISIRREHLADITDEGVRREGVVHSVADPDAPFMPFDMPYSPSMRAFVDRLEVPDAIPAGPRAAFASLWDSIYGSGSGWIENPEVWVLGLALVEEAR